MKNILITIFFLIPTLLFAQEKDRGIYIIDSLEAAAAKMPDNKNNKGALMANIGLVYREKGSFSKSVEYYQKALKIFENTGNKNGQSRVCGNIGSTYLQIAASAPDGEKVSAYKAVEYLNRCVLLAHENGYADIMDMFHNDLAVALRMVGNNGTSVIPAVEGPDGSNTNTASDSISIKIANAGVQNNEDEDQLKIHKGEKERIYYIGGISVLALVLVVVVLTMYWTYKRQKSVNVIISAEKKKTEELILNILPEQAAAELKSKGMVHPQQFDNVTVLLTDFVGFTTAAEKFSPKQLVGELHTCFKAFDGMLEKYSIEKIKTIGDAYLAIAGVPVPDADHAVHAVSLAVKMRDFMLYRKSQLGDATFEMRIGLHTGSVVAGIVGSKKFAYDIWGDTVNLAARMEQNSVAGKINISQSTYELVKHKFHCEYRGEVEAKNKGKLKMYYVLEEL